MKCDVKSYHWIIYTVRTIHIYSWCCEWTLCLQKGQGSLVSCPKPSETAMYYIVTGVGH